MNTKPFYKRLIGISAKEIAARIGCPIQTVYDWKSGRRSPSPWVQEIIIEILLNEAIRHYESTTK